MHHRRPRRMHRAMRVRVLPQPSPPIPPDLCKTTRRKFTILASGCAPPGGMRIHIRMRSRRNSVSLRSSRSVEYPSCHIIHFIIISFHFIIIHDETRKKGSGPGPPPHPPTYSGTFRSPTFGHILARHFCGRFPERLFDRSGSIIWSDDA